MAPSIILVDGAASMAQVAGCDTSQHSNGSPEARVYNQKGGCTVVVRVVLAGRGGAAPSAVVCCTVGFRLSAPRNALRDSFRSSFMFGQT